MLLERHLEVGEVDLPPESFPPLDALLDEIFGGRLRPPRPQRGEDDVLPFVEADRERGSGAQDGSLTDALRRQRRRVGTVVAGRLRREAGR